MTWLRMACLLIVEATSPLATGLPLAAAGDPLWGTWTAESVIVNGRPAPDEVVKLVRFSFEAKQLAVQGNFGTAAEETCDYQIDAECEPAELTFTPRGAERPILAIYQLDGDELKLCIRHARSLRGRPKAFLSVPGSNLVLISLRRAAEPAADR